MKYTEFLHTIETEITARLDNNFKLTIHPVKKNNGMIYDGLVIINPKFNIVTTIISILTTIGILMVYPLILFSMQFYPPTMISSQLKILT